MSLTLLEVGQSNTPFTFTFSILILSSTITIPKNPTFLTFHLYFSGFTYTYKLFSTKFFTTSSTTLSCSSFFFISTITLSMKLATSPVLIKFHRILFIIVWNIARKLVSPKNIIVGSNNSSRVVNATFHLFSSFIYILLYSHLKFNFVNIFFVPMFSTISKIKGKG